MAIDLSRSIRTDSGAYTGLSLDRTISFKTRSGKRTFRIVLYGAFNAMGLIGPENNGIVVFDDDQKQVLADQLGCETSGWCGPSRAQVELFKSMERSTWEEFRARINESKRNRYTI